MAIIKQGILGGGSGSVAGVVMSSWKGRAILKAKPLSVANPKTDLQVAQRTSFKSIAQLGSLLLTGYVQKVCNVISGNITGFNKFCSDNAKAFSSVGVFVPSKFYVGGGILPIASGLTCVPDGGFVNLEVTWAAQPTLPAIRQTDKALFVAFCPSTGDVWISAGALTRTAHADDLLLITPGSDLTGELQIYVGPVFKSANGFDVSLKTVTTQFTCDFE